MCSAESCPGEMCASSTVRDRFPTNASRSTVVSLEPRKGTRAEASPGGGSALFSLFSALSARMHSFSASNDVLISAPSLLIRSETALPLSAPRSEPARSTSESRAATRPSSRGADPRVSAWSASLRNAI